MGLVLAFETAPRPAPRPALRRADAKQGADILFFTGVRYERHDEVRAPEPARPAQPCELPSSHS